MSRSRLRPGALAALVSWVTLVGAGFAALYDFGYRSGQPAAPGPAWAEQSPRRRDDDRLTLGLIAALDGRPHAAAVHARARGCPLFEAGR